MWACLNGHIAVVNQLLKHDSAGVKATDTSGKTALMLASNEGHDTVVAEQFWRDREIGWKETRVLGDAFGWIQCTTSRTLTCRWH